MKTKLVVLLWMLAPSFIFSQSNSSIDFVGGLEYSYRSLKLSPDANLPIDIIGQRNDRELGKLNWRLGFNYNKKLTSKLHLKTGIRLASVGHKDEKQTSLIWPSEIGSNGYEPDPSLPKEVQFIRDYWFIEIPLAARYEFKSSKVSPFIEAGISPSYFITARTQQVTNLDTKVTYVKSSATPYNSFHWVGFVSVGSNVDLNEKIQLFGQAIFRQHFTSLSKDAPISEYLYNFGVELGVRRKF